MEKKSGGFNPWPYAIALSILGVFGLCVWTVKEASNNPVEMDPFYFDSYQNVEENYGQIVSSQKKFNKKYIVANQVDGFKLGDMNSVMIKISDKASNDGVDDVNISLLITRPDSSKFDKKPKLISAKDGLYKFEPVKIDKPGRWQIMTKIKIDNLTSFNKFEVNATK